MIITGSDLSGNTYWEFKESLSATRLRRIVKYNPKTHYADVKVSRKPTRYPRNTEYKQRKS